MKSPAVPFPPQSTIGDVDKLISLDYFSLIQSSPELTLDLSSVEFVEIASLAHIVSIIVSRRRNGFDTTIKLPRSKMVRDFLRSWDFASGIFKATKIRLWDIVVEEDKKYFGENLSEKDQRYAGKIVFHDGEYVRIPPENYFGFITFLRENQNFSSAMALKEAGRWKREAIQSVLKKLLAGPEGFFASRIIYEALMNSIRHPNAAIIQTSSCFRQKEDKEQKSMGHFTMVFWDDGQSIVDTLRDALDRDQKISYPIPSRYNISLRYIFEDLEGKKSAPKFIHSGDTQLRDSADEMLLLASLFPGITRDIMGRDHVPHPETKKTDEILSMPGMGLYLFINAAIKIYHGMVSIRTKNFFMNVKEAVKEKSEVNFSVKIAQRSEIPNFLGNMLTIRLPIS